MRDQTLTTQMQEILKRLSLLEEKYAGLGQDMLSYLEGLYYSNGLTYWEYIHLDSLLGLQQPRTPFKDEVVFIVYHQMTELIFKLIKLEIDSLTQDRGDESEYLRPEAWLRRTGRCVNYFRHLSNSFDIMLSGMDTEELRKFRMALLPASGFQSVQFREIEIMSSSLEQLVRGGLPEEDSLSIEELYPHLYWKQGGIDLETGKKTITLTAFEQRYDEELIQLLHRFETRNLYYLFMQARPEIRQHAGIIALLREYDLHANVYWKLSHLSAASRHLRTIEGGAIEATGGTNWRSFLPPRFQRVVFFPSLWSQEELDDWGKAAVVKQFQAQIARHWMQGSAPVQDDEAGR
ncbi:MAG: tryptophan 2,3-dioxygenase family protein [Bacteroidia bacterium]|nr:tryptophan 2,3-dioxygenase family protein [Bacteroidia bacterium]